MRAGGADLARLSLLGAAERFGLMPAIDIRGSEKLLKMAVLKIPMSLKY